MLDCSQIDIVIVTITTIVLFIKWLHGLNTDVSFPFISGGGCIERQKL